MRNLECDPATLAGPIDMRVVAKIERRYPLNKDFLKYMAVCHGGRPRIGASEIDPNGVRLVCFLP